MTSERKTITECLSDKDWIGALDRTTKREAISYLNSLPDTAELYVNWHGYDGADGVVEYTRPETEAEYETRIQYELELEQERLRKAEAKRLKEAENAAKKKLKDLEEIELLKARIKELEASVK